MIDAGVLDGVDEVYGWHAASHPALALGTLLVKPGAVMAHASEVAITVVGRGGHASQPQECIDPVNCATAMAQQLNTIVSRSIAARENAVFSICTIHGGERSNVIPDRVTLGGTIRDFSARVFERISARIREVAEGCARSHGCSAEVDIRSGYPPTVNTALETEAVRSCARALDGPLALRIAPDELLPAAGAEDFAYFLEQRPGCFFFLAMGEALHTGLACFAGSAGRVRSNCVNHASDFDLNDNVLPRAVAMLLRIVEHRLGARLYASTQAILDAQPAPAPRL